jgi:hypothetical protein
MSANMYDAWDCGDRPAIRAKLAKQEAIYRFAKQSGFIWPECFDEELEKFVALVEAAEREACAQVVNQMADQYVARSTKPENERDIKPEVAYISILTCGQIKAAIRARGQE